MDRDLSTETAKQQARINSIPNRCPEGLTVNELLDAKIMQRTGTGYYGIVLGAMNVDQYLNQRMTHQR